MAAERLSRYGVWPVVSYDPAGQAIIITGNHDKPGLFQLWGGVYLLAGLWALMKLSGGPVALFTLLFYMILRIEGAWTPADNPRGWLCLALIILLPLLYRPVWKKLIIALLGGHVWVKVTQNEIMLKSGGRTFSLPRARDLQVGREPHQRGLAESRRQGVAGKLPVLYQDALEVVIWYGTQRVTIAEMVWRDKDKATALALRLQEIIRDFENLVEKVGGAPPRKVAASDAKESPAPRESAPVPLPDAPADQPARKKRRIPR